jgi:uncharacterized membrane protein
MKRKLDDDFRLNGFTKELRMSRLKDLGVPDHVAVSMTDRQIQEYVNRYESSEWWSLCVFISIGLMFFSPIAALALFGIATLIEFRNFLLGLVIVFGLFVWCSDSDSKQIPEKETRVIEQHYKK